MIVDPILVNRLHNLLTNATSIPTQRRGLMQDPRRNIYDECGYPRGTSITCSEYYDLYDREAVANRVVRVFPIECAQVQPTIYESKDPTKKTPFDEDVASLQSQLRGRSWFKGAVGNPIADVVKKVDIVSGIGHYGVLLIGFDDQRPLSTPYVPTEGMKVKYIRAYSEMNAQVASACTDKGSSRYGQPEEYNITTNNLRNQGVSLSLPSETRRVHWTRIVHVAEHVEDGAVFGTPRLRPVLNNVLGLQKLLCGSPEMFWKGAFYGLSLESLPQFGADADVDEEALKDMMELYGNGLQRWIWLVGMQAKPLAPNVVDLSPHVLGQMQAICVQLTIPMRVFMGSERGEQASTQDDSAWNDRVKERENNYITPGIYVPLLDRLIWAKVLREPVSYNVEWPDITSMSDLERSQAAAAKIQALASYIQGGVDVLVPPLELLTRFFGIDLEVAKSVLFEAQKQIMREAA